MITRNPDNWGVKREPRV